MRGHDLCSEFQSRTDYGSCPGAALSAPAIKEIPVFEYAPLRVKRVCWFWSGEQRANVADFITDVEVKNLFLMINQMPSALLFAML